MSTYPWKHGAPRTVFITGASSGIGRDMAHRLAMEGAHIALFNRSGAEARFLVVGSKASSEIATYSDVDLVLHVNAGTARFAPGGLRSAGLLRTAERSDAQDARRARLTSGSRLG